MEISFQLYTEKLINSKFKKMTFLDPTLMFIFEHQVFSNILIYLKK